MDISLSFWFMLLDVKLINSFNRYIEIAREEQRIWMFSDMSFKVVYMLWENGKRLNGCTVDPNEGKVNRYFVNMGLTGKIDNDVINVFNTDERNAESNEFTFVAVIENEVKRSLNEIKSKAVYIDDVSIQVKNSASKYTIYYTLS